MTRDPYTEHMDEMLRLGGAHECASDCPMPLPRRRPDPRPTPDRAEPTEAREQLRQEWFRLRRDSPSDPRVKELESALLRMPGDPQPNEWADELILMRDISDRLRRVAGNYRILAACRLLESGRAASWIDAVRLVREAEARVSAPASVEGLRDAIHYAMCDVSHHGYGLPCKNDRRYELVAESVHRRLSSGEGD